MWATFDALTILVHRLGTDLPWGTCVARLTRWAWLAIITLAMILAGAIMTWAIATGAIATGAIVTGRVLTFGTLALWSRLGAALG